MVWNKGASLLFGKLRRSLPLDASKIGMGNDDPPSWKALSIGPLDHDLDDGLGVLPAGGIEHDIVQTSVKCGDLARSSRK